VRKAIEETTLVAYEMTAAALERLSGADRRARLDRDLLDEAHYQHHGRDQALRWVLDEDGLPDSRQDIPFGGAVHFAGDGSHYANHPRSS
jgi:hypothetical protein